MDQGTQRLIRRHNAQMRDLIVRDIDALERKLNVKRQVSDMADNAVDTVKGKLGMNSSNPNEGWMDFVRHNAAPLAAVGLGGVVLAKNLQARAGSSTTSTSPRYVPADVSSDESSGVREQVGEKLSDVASSASEGMSAASDKASQVADTVTTQAVAAKDAVVDRIPSRQDMKVVAHDHGQALGVAALAVGALAGVLTPRSTAEQRRLAPVQSHVRDTAGDLFEQGIDKAKEQVDVAASALSTGVEAAKDEFQDAQEDGAEPEPPGTSQTSDLPDMTQPNRITGSRVESANGSPGTHVV
jgi:hypothetical protein